MQQKTEIQKYSRIHNECLPSAYTNTKMIIHSSVPKSYAKTKIVIITT